MPPKSTAPSMPLAKSAAPPKAPVQTDAQSVRELLKSLPPAIRKQTVETGFKELFESLS